MEKVVLLVLERDTERSLAWLRMRSIFMSALRRYPASSLSIKRRGRVYRKVFLCLKRHETLWTSILTACGWKLVERREIPLPVFESILRNLHKVLEDLRKVSQEAPEILEYLGISISLGNKPVEKLIDLLESFRRRLEEYRIAPEALRSSRFARTSFLRELRRGKVYAILIAGTDREYLAREVESCLRTLVERLILPIDYGLNQIIVLRSFRMKKGEPMPRFYAARVDPERVLDLFKRPPGMDIVEVDGEKAVLIFEERDIGYGLRVSLKW